MKFFNDLHIPGTVIQIGEVNNVLFTSEQTDLPAFLEKNRDKNLYFCANIDAQPQMRSKATKHPLRNRASDVDIVKKKYIYFDFDIRKDLAVKGVKIKDQEIKELALKMGEWLNERQSLCNWSYILFTGNGLHIYYIETKEHAIDHEYFSIGYEYLRKRMHKILGYEPDSACKNPARIARIPGSYNHKGKPKLVEIVCSQNKKSSLIPLLLKKGKEEASRKALIAKQEADLKAIRIREALYSTDEIIDRINQIPIEREILKDYPDWNFDGKNFWRNGDGERACSSFVSSKTRNVLIIDGSRWFASISQRGVGTYLYRREMDMLTPDGVKEYFKTNYNL